jgi:hypothetical protein
LLRFGPSLPGPIAFRRRRRMREDANYCWVVLCKNHWFHKNIFFRPKIPLGQTDAVTPLPLSANTSRSGCDECRSMYIYKPKDMRRVKLELPESFKPHPFCREDAEDEALDSNRSTAQEERPQGGTTSKGTTPRGIATSGTAQKGIILRRIAAKRTTPKRDKRGLTGPEKLFNARKRRDRPRTDGRRKCGL